MSDTETSSMGVADVLAMVFVVLKLTHVINWSWWWVLSPLWISFAIWFCGLLLGVIATVIESRRRK